MVDVNVIEDDLVEGIEVFNVVIETLEISPAPCVFIIDNDCKAFPSCMWFYNGLYIGAFRFEGWFFWNVIHGG